MLDRGQPYDILVIGGGINGCGIARDATGRGYSVFLAEMNDLASGTSSLSTKLVHGGLRYLEHYEFRLVRESLKEREVLWSSAPHLIRPLRFVLPHHDGLRAAWLLRLGLFLYDHLGGRELLPPTRTLDMRSDPAGSPLKPLFSTAFEYSDCWVDDARLVILNARDAAARGAIIRTRAEVISMERSQGVWQVGIRNRLNDEIYSVRARLLVNAAGPWVKQVAERTVGGNGVDHLRLVQGSHIVVPKLFDHGRAYVFQNADGRIVFALPYEGDYTLIGTTDLDYEGDPASAAIGEEEKAYLCAAINGYFSRQITPAEVVWTYSGVRPLYDDGASTAQEATRDYVLRQEGNASEGALINVFGGKITTYRKLAEAVLAEIEAVLGTRSKRWTERAALPGGEFPVDGVESETQNLIAAFPFLSEPHAHRLFRLYGTDAKTMLAGAARHEDLGRCFGADLYEREVRYLMAREWAVTADDVLWRRTKCGLKLSATEANVLAEAMAFAEVD